MRATVTATTRSSTTRSLAALAHTTWRPTRTYLWCLPRSLLAGFAGVPGLGTPDEDITTWVNVVATSRRAMGRDPSAHVADPPYDAMTSEVAHAFLATDCLLRVDPPWTGGPVEHDWIPG